MNIRTRFAPSPTGFIHIGNIRTALFSWLYAKKYNGDFIIRIDDTDIERNSKIYVNNILYILKWLNITSKNKIIFQSKRINRYKKIIHDLLIKKLAYKCYCSKERLTLLKETQIKAKKKVKYDGLCKNLNKSSNNFIIRIDTQAYEKITFTDKIKGKITFDIEELSDFIIAKNNFYPTYNLASVIDDIDLDISDIIRGDDHISNTPKQIIIFNALNSTIPIFSHLPMIMNENKKPLSKRDKESRIDYYKNKGFLPEAMLNYIIRLGWSNKNQEIFNLDDMIHSFNLDNITNSPSILNNKKLIWLNKHYIKKQSCKYILKELFLIEKKFKLNYMLGPNLTTLINITKNRVNTLEEIITHNKFLYEDLTLVDKISLKNYLTHINIDVLKNMYLDIKKFNKEWDIENIKNLINTIIHAYQIELNKIAPLIRLAVTGTDNPRSIYELIFLSGKILILKKIRNIIKQYEKGL